MRYRFSGIIAGAMCAVSNAGIAASSKVERELVVVQKVGTIGERARQLCMNQLAQQPALRIYISEASLAEQRGDKAAVEAAAKISRAGDRVRVSWMGDTSYKIMPEGTRDMFGEIDPRGFGECRTPIRFWIADEGQADPAPPPPPKAARDPMPPMLIRRTEKPLPQSPRTPPLPTFKRAERPVMVTDPLPPCPKGQSCAIQEDGPVSASYIARREAHRRASEEADRKDKEELLRLHGLQQERLKEAERQREAARERARQEQASFQQALREREAEIARQRAEHERKMQIWRARVIACNNGDVSQCASQ